MQAPNREVAKILVVDDLASNRLALEAILEPLEQEVIAVSSGNEALSMVLQYDFACILMDVQMPGMSGIEAAKLIKQRERSRHIPILFITAFSRTENEVSAAYANGAVDYIVKPFQPDILRTKVAVFVDLHLQARRLLRHGALLRDRDRDVMTREADERLRPAIREARARAVQTEQAFSAMVTASPVGMGLLSAELRYLVINEALARVHGVSVSTAKSAPLLRLAPHLTRQLVQQIDERDSRPGPVVLEQELATAEGERRLVTVTFDPSITDGPAGMVLDATGVKSVGVPTTTHA